MSLSCSFNVISVSLLHVYPSSPLSFSSSLFFLKLQELIFYFITHLFQLTLLMNKDVTLMTQSLVVNVAWRTQLDLWDTLSFVCGYMCCVFVWLRVTWFNIVSMALLLTKNIFAFFNFVYGYQHWELRKSLTAGGNNGSPGKRVY